MLASLGVFCVAQEKNIIIIGCGAGGGTAAQFARKTDRKAHITVLEKGQYPQYSKCGLPYAIAGEIAEFTELIEFSSEWFKKEHIDLLLETRVEKIDSVEKKVLAEQQGKKQELSYDRLIIATGANPVIPPIEGLYHNGTMIPQVGVLRTIEDGKQIKDQIKNRKKVTIIGAGLIGLELADTLMKRKNEVTVIEALPNILATTLDSDISLQVLQQISAHVRIFCNYFAEKIIQHNTVIKGLQIKNRDTNESHVLDTDYVILATGCKPDVDIARSIGCQIGATGGIKVNNKTETSIPGVYAVGDCTEYVDFITGKPVCIGLGSIVVRQGIAAGVNAAGGNYVLPPGVLLTRTSEFFGVEIAAVGPIENNLKNKHISYGKFRGLSRPEYFPGGESISMKVGIDEETKKFVCAQAIGSNAAQRINVYAAAILSGVSADLFKTMETAYAPPIAPTLDVLTLVCDVALLKLERKRRLS